jgi:putative ABC transport system permease protein
MLTLAARIIAHRPKRYLVALLGISVATGLALIQYGLYRGFKENASVVVDHTEADIWVRGVYSKNFDFPRIQEGEQLQKIRAIPGVAWSEPLLIVFAKWKFESGEETTVQVIGFNSSTGRGRPWNMSSGLPQDLEPAGNVSVDISTRHKLGTPDLGTEAEINGIHVKVAALTNGIRSFQGNPMIFTNLETARSIGRLGNEQLHYIIAGVEKDVSISDVADRVEIEAPFTEAFTQAEMSKSAQDYWLRSTGAGTALALSALMGLIVGIVVAGQVLYSSTLEHIKEYGTLKAIGASNLQVARAIVSQALMWAFPAHLIAGGLLLIAMKNIEGAGIHVSIDTTTYWYLGGLTVTVCVMASLLSVAKVYSIEPADVFK